MGIARSSFYQARHQSLAQMIESLQQECHFTIGRRRMGVLLKSRCGTLVSEGRLQRVMSQFGLGARIRQIRKTRARSGSVLREGQAKNLLDRNFQATQPGHRLLTDVTYVPYFENAQWHWGYLSLVMDLFDRSILCWVYSKRQDNKLAQETLQILSFKSLSKNAMIHSDHGSIYTANAFREQLSRMGITQSLSRVGNCHDNAPMECFNGTFKVEALYNPLVSLEKPSFYEQNQFIAQYLEFYNNRRPCSVLNNQTPSQYRKTFLQNSSPCL